MKIAVIGGGISGLSAAMILTPHHDVHLFEAETTLGGHAHTITLPSEGRLIPLETGFFVYNVLTYPHFRRFLEYLGVSSVESNMSLSVQSDNQREWGGANLAMIYTQLKSLLKTDFLGILNEILQFGRLAEENLRMARENHWNLQDLIDYRSYSPEFQNLFLLPVTGAVWSLPFADALKFPAETVLSFCMNHRLLEKGEQPLWKSIAGGSVNYVNRVRERLNRVYLGTKVNTVRSRDGKLIVATDVHELEYDKVIMATHAPVSRALLQPSFPDLAAALEPFRVTRNRIELHQDESVMPRNRDCWSSWNVKAQEPSNNIELTYYLNMLQSLGVDKNYFTTLNSSSTLDHVHRTFFYDHPQFDFAALSAQQKLSSIQGRHGVYLAGAWTRYGFHEDGLVSGIEVARRLGCEPPWTN